MGWIEILGASIVLVCSLLGIALTLISLPGIWLALGVAIVVKIWQPELIGPWVLIASFAIAVLAELIEALASVVGAKKTGGTRAGAWGALIGAIVGAIVGTGVMPLIGTIAGGVIGAGALAMIAEIGVSRRGWQDSAKVGAGAAAGRLVAVVVKGGLAAVVAILLSVAAFVP